MFDQEFLGDFDYKGLRDTLLQKYPAIRQILRRDSATIPLYRVCFMNQIIQFNGWTCELYFNFKRYDKDTYKVISLVLNPLQLAPADADQYEM